MNREPTARPQVTAGIPALGRRRMSTILRPARGCVPSEDHTRKGWPPAESGYRPCSAGGYPPARSRGSPECGPQAMDAPDGDALRLGPGAESLSRASLLHQGGQGRLGLQDVEAAPDPVSRPDQPAGLDVHVGDLGDGL